MEQCSSAFLRLVLFLLHVGILFSSQCFTVGALASTQAAANGDLIVSRRSVVDNNSVREVRALDTKHIIDAEAILHRRQHYREKFRASSYVRANLRRQQNLQQQREEQQRKKAVNLRKLSSQFGCLSNATMCLTVPGWTAASSASTCCSTGFCTDIHFDGLNCGSCGNACDFGYFCCSGVCVATTTDPQNCGRCANVCTTGVCGFGFCGY